MSFYFVKGPIYNGDEVMLCVFSGITPYYVCYNDSGYQLEEYGNKIDIAIFRIDNNGQSLYDIKYHNYALIGTNNKLNTKTGSSIIKAVPNKYQPWVNRSINSMSNIVFLAGESYQMNIRLDGIPFNITYVIPAGWYQRGLCGVKRDHQSALVNNQASLTNIENVQGWTTQAECEQDVWYDYCNKGVNCSSACKGSCPNSTDQCLYIDGEFQCGQADGWWMSDWFLILLYLGLILIMIYYLFDLSERSKNKRIEEDNQLISNTKDGDTIGRSNLSYVI